MPKHEASTIAYHPLSWSKNRRKEWVLVLCFIGLKCFGLKCCKSTSKIFLPVEGSQQTSRSHLHNQETMQVVWKSTQVLSLIPTRFIDTPKIIPFNLCLTRKDNQQMTKRSTSYEWNTLSWQQIESNLVSIAALIWPHVIPNYRRQNLSLDSNQ